MAQFLSETALEDLTQFEIRLEGLSERIVDRNRWKFSSLRDEFDRPPNPIETKGPNWGAGSVYKYCRGVLTKIFGV